MKNMIEIKNLTKKYDDFTLGEINLDIPCGEIIGLIGENGAGKTTLIKSLLNIISPSTGDVTILGHRTNDKTIKNDIGVVLDNMFFPEILTCRDINSIMKDIYDKWDESLFKKYIEDFKLPFDKPLKSMSKGMRKKTEIATSLAHHPKLLILDEPTTGLDPIVRTEVLDIFRDFIQDEEHAILLSTHITSDLERIADRIIFIDKGHILLNEPHDEIIDNYGILRCDEDYLENLSQEEYLSYKKNKYNCDVLVKDKTKFKSKHKDCVIDKITLEDLMLLIIKGEKK